jgi:ubiquinone/menaquinone biosynthesis C-methylase UbiE
MPKITLLFFVNYFYIRETGTVEGAEVYEPFSSYSCLGFEYKNIIKIKSILNAVDTNINQKLIKKQYQNPSHLNTRRNLQERFSTNRYGWWRWIFDHFNFPPNCKILELGSGLGLLWLENEKRIPKSWDITLTDFSTPMLDKTKQDLSKIKHNFKFKIVDIQDIPYSDEEFDAVIANHMLYLVPDIEKAIAEAARVTKPGGIIIASTNGSSYMKELEDLLEKSNLPVHRGYNKYTFSLDNGKAFLVKYFSKVEVFRYEDALLVTEAEPLVAHILSTNEGLNEKQIKEVNSYFKQYFVEHQKLLITKDIGLFIAQK